MVLRYICDFLKINLCALHFQVFWKNRLTSEKKWLPICVILMEILLSKHLSSFTEM